MSRRRARLAAVIVAASMVTGCGGAVAPHDVTGAAADHSKLATQLYTPKGDGPFPAVVVMHGCGGVAPNARAWAEWLRGEGYAALVVDSFTNRGLKRICGDATVLPARIRFDDAYVAAASLKRVPAIDVERVAVMGFSHGGASTLWAARTEGAARVVKLKAFIALYPGCADLDGSLPGTGPVLMLLGGADNWAAPAPCQHTAMRARAAGRVVQDITYPNAHHAFDAANLRGRVHVADARRGQGATVEYDPAAHADSEKQIREFLARYLR